jgi:two-component system, OmpR family, KDP operon response regulator KdpE
MSRVLLVEDDIPLRRALRGSLLTGDFDVLETATGEEALVVASVEHPELVLLDLMLPGIDGLETLRHLRSFSEVPVVVITVRDTLADKVAALDAGADDYVVKPCAPEELLARVRANLRRSSDRGSESTIVRTGDVEIDLSRRQVTWRGERVNLRPIEMRVLETLVANRGRLLSHDELLAAAWDKRPASGHQRIRFVILRLRRKLHDDAARPRLVFTEPGLGYRWIADAEDVEEP